MTTPRGEQLSSEKLLRETEKLHARLLSTVTELELFVTALSAMNAEQAEWPLGEDPDD